MLALLALLVGGALGQTEAPVSGTTEGKLEPGSIAYLLKKCLIAVSVNGKEQVEEALSPPKDIFGFFASNAAGLSKNLEVKINKERVFKVGNEDTGSSHSAVRLLSPASAETLYVKSTAKEGVNNVTFLACHPSNVTLEILSAVAGGADGSGLDPELLAALGLDADALVGTLGPVVKPGNGNAFGKGKSKAPGPPPKVKGRMAISKPGKSGFQRQVALQPGDTVEFIGAKMGVNVDPALLPYMSHIWAGISFYSIANMVYAWQTPFHLHCKFPKNAPEGTPSEYCLLYYFNGLNWEADSSQRLPKPIVLKQGIPYKFTVPISKEKFELFANDELIASIKNPEGTGGAIGSNYVPYTPIKGIHVYNVAVDDVVITNDA
jgi:hypothetical protein